MAVIRDALSVLPAKPAVLIAPLIVVVVLSMYYLDLRDRCIEIRDARQSLLETLRATESGSRFRLADFTDFDWNKVRIVTRVNPGTVNDECYFDWNWRSGERQALLETGRLSALVFGQSGRVVGYYELRRDEINFEEIEQQLSPDEAVFEVRHADGVGAGLNLLRSAEGAPAS